MKQGNIRTNLPLTAERARQLWSYNRETGDLINRVGRNHARVGTVAGTRNTDYITVYADGVPYRAHRVAFLMETGRWPRQLLDHVNGDRRDNRWCNLREATYAQNAMNKRPGAKSKTGHVGVCRDSTAEKWMAHISVDGKSKTLGRFQSFDDAVAIRCEAEKHYFGDFARQAARYPTDE